MKKYSLFLAAIALISIFTSCDQSNIAAIYDAGGKVTVAFPSTVFVKPLTSLDSSKILIPIYRSSKVGTGPAVGLKFTPGTKANGIFHLQNDTVRFENGSAVAYAVITFPVVTALGPTTSYTMDLSITDTAVWSPNIKNKISITANRKLTFVKLGTGTKLLSAWWEDGVTSHPIVVYKAAEGNVYKVPAFFDVEGYPALKDFIFAVDDNGVISYESQNTGCLYDDTYGEIWCRPSSYITTATSTLVGKVATIYAKYFMPYPLIGTTVAGSNTLRKEILTLP